MPFTTRVPRLTRVSEGNPFFRLLVASKPELVEVLWFGFHGTPPSQNPEFGERIIPTVLGSSLSTEFLRASGYMRRLADRTRSYASFTT